MIQKIYGTKQRTTNILIHELVHINQFQSDFYSDKNKLIFKKNRAKNERKLELCTDVISLSVIRIIFGKNSLYEKDFFEFKKIQTSIKAENKEINNHIKKWDFEEKTLRDYIFK